MMELKEEMKEREHQIEAIRQYNQNKRNVYNARLSKFLRLYPYRENDEDYGMDKFYRTVNTADFDKLNFLIELFNEENRYWNSCYVLRNCNRMLYEHIIKILTKMHDSLVIKAADFTNASDEECKYDDPEDYISNDWGKQAEREVEYVLKWLTDDYVTIKKDCTSKYGNNCIMLSNDKFIDESQEYDHIVIGPQGIFLVETKNYSGKLYIDSAGNWIRMKNGDNQWVSENNPVQQVNRHHILMESIVGSNVPIIDVICLAHPNLIVSGQENSKIPVVKKDLLGDFIMNYKQPTLSKDEIEKIFFEIQAHKM